MSRTIVDILARLADSSDHGIVEYDRRGRAGEMRSHAEIHRRARAAAAAFAASGVEPGHVVFLQLPNGHDLVECFLGAVVAGALPCCLAPPRALGGLEAYQQRIAHLASAFPASHLIAEEDTGSRSGHQYTQPPDRGDGAPLADLPEVAPESIAFLQLTSGTSRTPKAVRISHAALCANVRGILDGGRGVDHEAYVSWLPLYHDMGLVGMLFCALESRSTMHLFRPETFVARPLNWLKTIASTGAPTITTVPNFALQHCVNAVTADKLEGLDFSRWRVSGCGAERVRESTLREFAERFGPFGFRSEAFVPCYGMAEATLAITFDRKDAPPREVDGHVSCGRAVPGTEIVIRSVEGEPVPEGVEGEITARGPGLCSGYTGDVVESPIRDGWLHTGDRGFVRDGELFVTGRFKDLIIIDGHNIDPDEVEAIGDRVVRTPGGRCGSFSVDRDGREHVVLVVEVPTGGDNDRFTEWADAIGSEFASLFGFRIRDLVFVKRGDLPTTSSGKVRRAQLRTQYEAGELDVLARHES